MCACARVGGRGRVSVRVCVFMRNNLYSFQSVEA